MRGHVPDTALRTDVVAMLERSVGGGSIPIGGSLLVLPQPQCDVLNAVEGLRFPQSVDRPTIRWWWASSRRRRSWNSGKARRSTSACRRRSSIYVDYYDGDGNVIHLLPNEYTQDNRLAAIARRTRSDRGSGRRGHSQRFA